MGQEINIIAYDTLSAKAALSGKLPCNLRDAQKTAQHDEKLSAKAALSGKTAPQKPARRRSGIQKRKSLKRRIRRLKRLVCMGVMCVALLAAFNGVKNLFGRLNLQGVAGRWEEGTKGQGEAGGEAAEEALAAPRFYTDAQVEEKLSELSNLSKDYQTIYENRGVYPPEMLAALCNNGEMLDFVLNYPQRTESPQGGFTAEETDAALPLLMQWDKRWGYVPYGSSCIGLSGCAPTCLSMVVLALTDNPAATPDAIATYAWQEGYYTEGTGTAWSFLTDGAAHWGVTGQELGLDEAIVTAELEAGHPIICSMRPGDFTTAGHFIVLAGMEDGKIRVNDPNSSARSGRLWEFETLKRQIKNLWAYEIG